MDIDYHDILDNLKINERQFMNDMTKYHVSLTRHQPILFYQTP